MQVIVDSLVTQYELTGQGKLILLLHGWGDDLRTYLKLQSELSADYRVIAVDLPGFGGTQAPPKGWSLDEYGNFLRQFLAKLQISQPYAIIGHSNGGAIAIRAFASHTLQPEKMVLLASAGIRNMAGAQRFGIKVIAKVGKIVTFWLPKSARQQLQKKIYGTIGSDMMVVPEMRETFKLTVRQDIQNDAKTITVPTMLIYGSNDVATPLDDAKQLHGLIQNSNLEIIPEAGHFVHHDAPDQVTSLIKDFLR